MAQNETEFSHSHTLKAEQDSAEHVIVSNNDANWVEEHNAVGQSDASDPTAIVAGAQEDIGGEAADRVKVSGRDADWVESHNGVSEPTQPDGSAEASTLPSELLPTSATDQLPPLPLEPLPERDDGWAPVWEPTTQAFYFYNRLTGASQWTNPRVPNDPSANTSLPPGPPGVDPPLPAVEPLKKRLNGGYDPAKHGDYDPNAWYAQEVEENTSEILAASQAGEADPYAATGAFNRFTGRWQAADITPENYNDENKSKRQMNAFFDVDAAANSHDGKSLKAERSGKKLSKAELKQFKEKRKAKKEEKRRAWLRD